jgi:protein-S-isoprenylcysteine O-methyltransferase Ste14
MKKNILTIFALIAVLAILGWQQRAVAWDAERIAGAAVSLTGSALVIIARVQLGGAFSVHAKATKLVTTGLYARIRNPIYISAMLVVVGLALYMRQLWILLFVPILIPTQVKRSRNEARVLHDAFGETYERYRAQTWF